MKKCIIKLVFIITLIILFFAYGLTGVVYAESTWETLCSSNDSFPPGFFAEDIDVADDGSIYCVDSERGIVARYSGGSVETLLSDPALGYSSVCLSSDGKILHILDSSVHTLTNYFVETYNFEEIELYLANINAISPTDIAVAPNNDIYITDYAGNCIHVRRADGSIEILTDSGGAGALTAPIGIDINKQGKMAVALCERGQVVFARPESNQFAATDMSSVEGGEVFMLLITAIDDYNNIYQVDSETDRIVVLDTGNYTYKTLYPVYNDNEYILAICTTGNYLYVCIGAYDYSAFRIDRCAIENEITGFSFDGIDAPVQIDSASNTISVTVPYETDLTSLIPNIEVTEGATVSLSTGSAYDFSSPVKCAVNSGVFGAREYTINAVKEEPPASASQPPDSAAKATEGTVSSSAAATDQAVSTTYISVTSESIDDELSDGAVSAVDIIIICAYFALLALWIILIFVFLKRKKHKLFIILGIVWFVIGVVFVVISLILTSNQTGDTLYVEKPEYEYEAFEPYQLSEEQRLAIDEYGFPDSFTILNTNGMRQETWFYYKNGFVIDYLGGIEIERIQDAELTKLDVGKTVYTPNDFAFGMTPGTALSAAGLDEFVVEPLDKEYVEDGVLYFGEGIVMGFIDDELYYVETMLAED